MTDSSPLDHSSFTMACPDDLLAAILEGSDDDDNEEENDKYEDLEDMFIAKTGPSHVRKFTSMEDYHFP